MSQLDPIARAVGILRDGGLIGLPTETVYGLAADAANPHAVARMFAAKGRPADHPVIVHLARAEQMHDWAIEIPDIAWTLARRFWPGPLSLIVKRASHVIDAVTGGQDTVGLRVPSHPLAQALLAEFGGGVAAPSANRFGRISPTTAQHVRDEFGDAVELVLDGGPCEVGIESTIIDCSRNAWRILRPGRITAEIVAAVLGGAAPGQPEGAAPRVSGALESHYAPRTPMRLLTHAGIEKLIATAGKRVVVHSGTRPLGSMIGHWPAPTAAIEYAHSLYATLRAMDAAGADLLLVELPPQTPEWDGINDRLRRASFDAGF